MLRVSDLKLTDIVLCFVILKHVQASQPAGIFLR